MENPQVENGHTKIANEIMDALIGFNLSGQELRLCLFVVRKTYGYNKKNDYIALSQMQKAINASKTRCSQIVNSLQRKHILTVKENINGLIKCYCFNKHYSQWTTVYKKRNRIEKTNDTVNVLITSPLIKNATTKDTITKDTITKDNKDIRRLADETTIRASEIISYLNLKANRSFKTNTPSFLKHIKARFKEGATFELMREVVDNRVWAWSGGSRQGDLNMSEYLRPDTLFSSAKFWIYAESCARGKMVKDAKKELKQKYISEGQLEDIADIKAQENARDEASAKIQRLKAQYGNVWFKHFNESEVTVCQDINIAIA